MPPQAIPSEHLELLRCQQTLEPLVPREEGLWSEGAGLLYRWHDGLLFGGYDASQDEFIQATMEEERAWQGTSDYVDRDLRFLKASGPAAVNMVNLVKRIDGFRPGLKALELGAGSGWVSWLFAMAGYDTWLCDFEANSLWLGMIYEHPGLGLGKRIVCDGTAVPFADSSFDLVICKEFAHHIEDKRGLFAEANRVLKSGGTILLADPPKTLIGTMRELRHPDTRLGHSMAWPRTYVTGLRSEGFRAVWRGAYYFSRPAGRNRLTSWIKRRSNERLINDERGAGPLGSLHFAVTGGGSHVVVAKKESEARRRPRPSIRLINPSNITATEADRDAFRPFRQVLESAAADLVR